MSKFFTLSKCVAIVAATAAICSCAKAFDAGFESEDYLRVSGTAYDAETLEPVEGIRVIMNSYSTSDTEKAVKIESDTTWTSSDGQYYSVLVKDRDLYYDIVAEDVDGKYSTSGFDHIVADGSTRELQYQDIYLKKN